MKHGMSKTVLYKKWTYIKKRCKSTRERDAKYYLNKGVKICDEWENDFLSFRTWSLNNGYEDHLTIDRKNPNGNYEPSNCRWTTKEVQSQNTRKIYNHNTSGYRGIVFIKKRNKFKSQISVNSKRIFLGYFEKDKDAAKAYDDFVIKNKLNHTRNF